MAFVQPEYTRGQVRRAGEALRRDPPDEVELAREMPVITNWRAAHAYPLNTFQATLRQKLSNLGSSSRGSLVGQRLKRLPSIEAKLKRFATMNLERMQDIAGLRAVVPGIAGLRNLHRSYLRARFSHQLRSAHDYVEIPKEDGYRSIHLVYRYEKNYVSPYDGLFVELQMRTRLQHSWATAVETVDIFANQAIKAGRASPEWGEFFKLASAAFAINEGCAPPTEYVGLSAKDIRARLIAADQPMNALVRLRAFAVAANHIQRLGRSTADYHLVILDTDRRRLTVQPFSMDQLDQATIEYANAERRAAKGEPIDAVLVAGGNIDQLRKTYPNYFLDATRFIADVYALQAARP